MTTDSLSSIPVTASQIYVPIEEARMTLQRLYQDAWKFDPVFRKTMEEADTTQNHVAHFNARKMLYMPINPEFGSLLYSLVLSSRAKNVVEFGMSFGISTIYIASALKALGEGKITTTEFIEEKAERAKVNFESSGLSSFVDIQIGDACETLPKVVQGKAIPTKIDFVHLDGAKNLYLELLKSLEPYLRPGAIIASDNTDKPALKSFLEYIRNPANGYVTSGVVTRDRGVIREHEISVRTR